MHERMVKSEWEYGMGSLGTDQVRMDLSNVCVKQGSRSILILFSERYVRYRPTLSTLTYSVLAYVNKNRIRTQTMKQQTG